MVNLSIDPGLFNPRFYPKLSWDQRRFLQRQRTVFKTIKDNRTWTCQNIGRTNQQANKDKPRKKQQRKLTQQKAAGNIADSPSDNQLSTRTKSSNKIAVLISRPLPVAIHSTGYEPNRYLSFMVNTSMIGSSIASWNNGQNSSFPRSGRLLPRV